MINEESLAKNIQRDAKHYDDVELDYFIKQYSNVETRAHIVPLLDSAPSSEFEEKINNLMKQSSAVSVPSEFKEKALTLLSVPDELKETALTLSFEAAKAELEERYGLDYMAKWLKFRFRKRYSQEYRLSTPARRPEYPVCKDRACKGGYPA